MNKKFIGIGLILVSIISGLGFLVNKPFAAYFPGCNVVYASYLDCVNYPDVGKCGKQTSVTCGYTFLGDLGSSQTTDCDFGYQTPLGYQTVTTLKYGQTYSFFAYNGYTWYIWGYNCPTTITTTTTTTTITTTTTTTTLPSGTISGQLTLTFLGALSIASFIGGLALLIL
jgi:hypothetical protein